MEYECGQPRKIFHFDNMPAIPSSNDQFWEEKWKAIETTVLSFLLDSKSPPSIVHINRALQAVLVRHMFEQLHENLIKTFYLIYKEVVSRAASEDNSLAFILTYY